MLLYKVYTHTYVDLNFGIRQDIKICINDWPSAWPNTIGSRDVLVNKGTYSYLIRPNRFDIKLDTIPIDFILYNNHQTITDSVDIHLKDLTSLTNRAPLIDNLDLITEHLHHVKHSSQFDIDFEILDLEGEITNKEFNLRCSHEVAGQPLQNVDDGLHPWEYCKKCGAWLKRL